MNTNRDASQRTQYNKAKALATYYQTTKNGINAGNVVLAPGRYSDRTASMSTGVVVGQAECCTTDDTTTSNSSGPTYTTYYDSFETAGSTTWTAPATCQSPITYWIVGGGGGGGGAYDQRGGGGGGGGRAVTGTYAVVAGTTYNIVVGAGGDGGTGIGTVNVTVGPFGSDTDGTDGTGSSFDVSNGGPVAAGGGKGLNGEDDLFPLGSGGGVSTGGNGGGGGRGGGGGGGAVGNGTDSSTGFNTPAGIGGTGVSFTIPGYNGGNARVYGVGGNGGVNRTFSYAVGASGSANTGNGGGGGGAASYQPPNAGGVIRMGGNGGSGLVVIQYSA